MDKALDGQYKVVVSGKEYPLAKLTLGDIADAHAFVKSERMSLLTGGIRTLPMTEQARGATFAAVVNNTLTLGDVLDDMSGRIKLLELSLKRGGNKFTYAMVRDEITPPDLQDLIMSLFYISGLVKAETDGPDPTITSMT